MQDIEEYYNSEYGKIKKLSEDIYENNKRNY